MGNSQTGNAAPANYKLGNQVDASTASLFKLHEATNADTGEKASAFVFTSIPGNDAAFTLVQNSIKVSLAIFQLQKDTKLLTFSLESFQVCKWHC